MAGFILAAGLVATGATANKQKVKDERADASSSFDYCDVLTATAGHKGKRVLVHSVKLAAPNVGKFASMSLYINTKGKANGGAGSSYGAEYVAQAEGILNVKTGKFHRGGVTGSVNKSGTKYTLKIKKNAFGSPKKYGWMAFGPACGDGTDSAPGIGPVFSTAFEPVFKIHKTKP